MSLSSDSPMFLGGPAGPSRAPKFRDALALLGSDSLITLSSQPGLVSIGLATENSRPSYAEVTYLDAGLDDFKLLVSVRTWANRMSRGDETQRFECFIEHYMSTTLTLHPGTPPDEYREPTFSDVRITEVLVDGVNTSASRIDDEPDGISGILTSVDGRLVTCVWRTDLQIEPHLVVTTDLPGSGGEIN
jgi:hypothetical protein